MLYCLFHVNIQHNTKEVCRSPECQQGVCRVKVTAGHVFLLSLPATWENELSSASLRVFRGESAVS